MKAIMLASRYVGGRASKYDNDRKLHPKWVRETEEIKETLKLLQSDDLTILDAPCGTGRLVDLLASNEVTFHSYLGLDVSADMLNMARKKIPGPYKQKMVTAQHDLLGRSAYQSTQISYAIFCLRFVNWIDKVDLRKLISFFKIRDPEYICMTCRVVRRGKNVLFNNWFGLIASLSYATIKREQHLHSTGELLQMLGPGWTLSKETVIERRSDCTDLLFLLFKKSPS